MKTKIIYSIFCVLFLTAFEYSYAQITREDQQAIEMIKEFYSARSTLKLTLQDQDKLESLQNRYCSKKIRKKIRKICGQSGLYFDVPTNDYGIDSLGLETLSISKDTVKSNVFIVSYSILDDTPSMSKIELKVIIHVTVKKEDGFLKLDDIE